MRIFVRPNLETRVRRFLLIVTGLIALVFAGVAGAHVIDEDTNLTIARAPKGKVDPKTRVVVFGRLRSDAATCRRGKLIELREPRPGADPVLAEDRTDAEGEYRFVLRPNRDLVLYTRFAGTLTSSYGHRHRCRGDNSRRIRIDVRRR